MTGSWLSLLHTFADGKGNFVGGAWTPWAYLAWLIAAVFVGRLRHGVGRWRARNRAGDQSRANVMAE